MSNENILLRKATTCERSLPAQCRFRTKLGYQMRQYGAGAKVHRFGSEPILVRYLYPIGCQSSSLKKISALYHCHDIPTMEAFRHVIAVPSL